MNRKKKFIKLYGIKLYNLFSVFNVFNVMVDGGKSCAGGLECSELCFLNAALNESSFVKVSAGEKATVTTTVVLCRL